MKKPAPIEIAIAMAWDGTAAPKVTAKGRGEIAAKIVAIAENHEIPLQQNTELVELLSTVELGDEIPAVLYAAVAEVIAFAYMISGKQPPHNPKKKR